MGDNGQTFLVPSLQECATYQQDDYSCHCESEPMPFQSLLIAKILTRDLQGLDPVPAGNDGVRSTDRSGFIH